MRSNPFAPLTNREGLPKKIYTDFTENDGEYIVEYSLVQMVKKIGDKDTDFIVNEKVVETNRIPRQEYINSFRSDVGILNIIEKVRISGDVTLLNQTGRIGYGASGDIDSLGRDLEPIVNVMNYQVDPVDGIEKIKAVRQTGNPFDDELGDLSFEALANLSDDQINAYLEKKKNAILAAKEAAKEGEK